MITDIKKPPKNRRIKGSTRLASNQEYLFAKSGCFGENLVTRVHGKDGLQVYLESCGFKIGPGVDLKLKG
jgi:hypothetical protein